MKRPLIGQRVRLIRDPKAVGTVGDLAVCRDQADIWFDDGTRENCTFDEIEPQA